MNPHFFDFDQPTPLVKTCFQLSPSKRIHFQIKRDDLIDKLISGNKWRKLKYNFKQFDQNKFKGIASFGGAFSNHIAALSAAGKRADIPTLGFIRTHEIDFNNPTLSLAKTNGMQLIALSREAYRNRHNSEFINSLKQAYPDYLFVPEGGSNDLAALGLAELVEELKLQSIHSKHHVIACAIGSGGTISGMMDAFPDMKFIGIAAVKDFQLLEKLKVKYGVRLTIVSDNLFGGYGKTTPELNQFCLDFYNQTQIPIEPIYTGKLLHTLMHNYDELMSEQKSLVVIHTGGLQGLKGLNYRHQYQSPLWNDLLSLTDV
ncbi:pyridoxal-phosphate dependent enzyme [Psychrosphaera aquimarina]|uniref:Pyridoxal-phosphate dependent enzyme n=1 Tax=Psychrosphaera aquimarina TaxID=2044854 RepID=A0ABU3R320_9GAMM|nr:pyridoxal-phosphate dependent enzyme [Psychrosphaera aquimarina]MDU0113693.1 pyridoxal-phosphate dependent enzyme [Psychrosphaera aquimarina]MDU0113700.1 pyridoxal-phosphate dependent enzyme [Psychrosphaera aquimarina]